MAVRPDCKYTQTHEWFHVEGKTVVFEYRWAAGSAARLPDLADELAELEPAVFVTHGTAGTRAAKRATASIPIVMIAALDAVGARLISSVTRPGGNITGTTLFSLETSAQAPNHAANTAVVVSRIALALRAAIIFLNAATCAGDRRRFR